MKRTIIIQYDDNQAVAQKVIDFIKSLKDIFEIKEETDEKLTFEDEYLLEAMEKSHKSGRLTEEETDNLFKNL